MKFSKILPDLPYPQAELSKAFQIEHERNKENFPGWSLLATRRKLIVSFWLKTLLNHYGVLLLFGIAWVLVSDPGLSANSILSGIVPASILTFLVILLSMYWPLYQAEFLPHLDNCMEAYSDHQLQGIQQCKKEQYSVLTLILIEYAERQLIGLSDMLINKETIVPLARKYGVSVKSIEKALQIVVLGNWNQKSLRKRTEIIDDFELAKNHFVLLSCIMGIKYLETLQQKIINS